MFIKRHLYRRQQLGSEGRVVNKTHGPSTVGPTEQPDSGCWHSCLIASRRTKDPHSSLQRKCPVYRARMIKQRPTSFFKCGLAKLPGRICPARNPRREATRELTHGSSLSPSKPAPISCKGLYGDGSAAPERYCQGVTQNVVSRLDLGANKDSLGTNTWLSSVFAVTRTLGLAWSLGISQQGGWNLFWFTGSSAEMERGSPHNQGWPKEAILKNSSPQLCSGTFHGLSLGVETALCCWSWLPDLGTRDPHPWAW